MPLIKATRLTGYQNLLEENLFVQKAMFAQTTILFIYCTSGQ